MFVYVIECLWDCVGVVIREVGDDCVVGKDFWIGCEYD